MRIVITAKMMYIACVIFDILLFGIGLAAALKTDRIVLGGFICGLATEKCFNNVMNIVNLADDSDKDENNKG